MYLSDLPAPLRWIASGALLLLKSMGVGAIVLLCLLSPVLGVLLLLWVSWGIVSFLSSSGGIIPNWIFWGGGGLLLLMAVGMAVEFFSQRPQQR